MTIIQHYVTYVRLVWVFFVAFFVCVFCCCYVLCQKNCGMINKLKDYVLCPVIGRRLNVVIDGYVFSFTNL